MEGRIAYLGLALTYKGSLKDGATRQSAPGTVPTRTVQRQAPRLALGGLARFWAEIALEARWRASRAGAHLRHLAAVTSRTGEA